MDSTISYGHSMSQPSPYGGIEMWHGDSDLYMNKLEEILNTPDDSDIEYFIEVHLRCPDFIQQKTMNFPFCTENTLVHKHKYNAYLKTIQPKN